MAKITNISIVGILPCGPKHRTVKFQVETEGLGTVEVSATVPLTTMNLKKASTRNKRLDNIAIKAASDQIAELERAHI